jgi:hypothetical protein
VVDPATGGLLFNVVVGGYFSLKRNMMSLPLGVAVSEDQVVDFTVAVLRVFRWGRTTHTGGIVRRRPAAPQTPAGAAGVPRSLVTLWSGAAGQVPFGLSKAVVISVKGGLKPLTAAARAMGTPAGTTAPVPTARRRG